MHYTFHPLPLQNVQNVLYCSSNAEQREAGIGRPPAPPPLRRPITLHFWQPDIHPKSHELRLGVLCLRQQSVSLTLQQVTDQTTVFSFVTGGSVVISLTDTSLTTELKQYVCSYTCIKKKRKHNLGKNKTPTLEY